jgi:hypothetical protein
MSKLKIKKWKTPADLKGAVVSPFLEEIIQTFDGTLCQQDSTFTEIPYNHRVFGALQILSATGLAKETLKPGHGVSWGPTMQLFVGLDAPPMNPKFPPLVIGEVEPVSDEMSQSILEYSEAFAVLFRGSEPLMRTIRAGFRSYASGLVEWNRLPVGKLTGLVP